MANNSESDSAKISDIVSAPESLPAAKGGATAAVVAAPARWTFPGTNVGAAELTILVVALLVFIAGVLVTQATEAPDPFPRLVQACVEHIKDVANCADVINETHERTHTFLYYNLMEAGAEALKAIAVAIAVTVGVASLLDARARDRLNASLAAKAQQIAINVFDGLFGNNHSTDLLEKLKRDILYKPIVRESLVMLYELTTYKGKGRLSGQRFTVVKAHVTSTFKNIATTEGSNARQPLELSLPNPLLNELKKITTLDSVVIRRNSQPDEIVTAAFLATANAQLQAALKFDEALEGVVAFGHLDLAPGEVGGFEIQYTMMKEAEDSELLRSFHTTESLHLTVIDSTDRNLVVRAKAIHAGVLKPLAGTETVSQWELREIVLPQQGVMIWWKERPALLPRTPRKRPQVVPPT